MTKDESDEESENELDRIKINKVLALIQTLSSLADRQQMAEQLLDKYNVSCCIIINSLIIFLLLNMNIFCRLADVLLWH